MVGRVNKIRSYFERLDNMAPADECLHDTTRDSSFATPAVGPCYQDSRNPGRLHTFHPDLMYSAHYTKYIRYRHQKYGIVQLCRKIPCCLFNSCRFIETAFFEVVVINH